MSKACAYCGSGQIKLISDKTGNWFPPFCDDCEKSVSYGDKKAFLNDRMVENIAEIVEEQMLDWDGSMDEQGKPVEDPLNTILTDDIIRDLAEKLIDRRRKRLRGEHRFFEDTKRGRYDNDAEEDGVDDITPNAPPPAAK